MRFESFSQRDTQDATSGDQAWQGINMTLDKPLLSQGVLSLGENTRVRTGQVIQRRGTTQPADFNPASGFGAPVVGSSVFRNPNGQEVLMIAPQGVTHTSVLQDGKDPYIVDYDAGATGNNGFGSVEFVQAFEQVLLLRNPLQGGINLVWDGDGTQTTPGEADSEWENTVLSSEGLTIVPGVWNGEPFMDRIIFYFANSRAVAKRDTWYLSDVLDYTSYDHVFQTIRTNTAEADYITRIMSYFRESVVIFKNQSIHMATLNPTYPVSMTQRILNRTVGSVGNKMPLMVGGDIIFLSQPNGFYKLSEVIQDQIAALPVPISERIQRVIDDINWNVTAEFGCSSALDNYAFFGVCLKSLPQHGCLNAILVYDTQRNEWESAGDTWADSRFCFNALHVTNYNGVHRLFAIDYTRGVIYLLYEGIIDEMPTGIFSVPFKMETRGYTGDDPLSFKRFGRAIVGIQTNDPEITITAISDGAFEEKLLTPEPITKDRTRYYSHGVAAFDPETDDPDLPYREDYSIGVNVNFIGQDYESIPVGEVVSIPGSAPNSESGQKQEIMERLLVRATGKWAALRIENVTGEIAVTCVGIESTRIANTGRLVA